MGDSFSYSNKKPSTNYCCPCLSSCQCFLLKNKKKVEEREIATGSRDDDIKVYKNSSAEMMSDVHSKLSFLKLQLYRASRHQNLMGLPSSFQEKLGHFKRCQDNISFSLPLSSCSYIYSHKNKKTNCLIISNIYSRYFLSDQSKKFFVYLIARGQIIYQFLLLFSVIRDTCTSYNRWLGR